MSAWHPGKRVPAWLVEKNKTRTQTPLEDRRALTEILREERAKRREKLDGSKEPE